MYKIKIHPFSYTYGRKNSPRCLYCEETIEIKQHDSVLITGNSGGGKTTFLQILKGIIPEFRPGLLKGEITYQGKPLSGEFFESNLKKILYLFQNPFTQLIYPLTDEEFFFSMENFNFSREKMDAAKKYFEEHFNLAPLWGRETKSLSNGECQKLVLASLLAIEPEVLLLDEPTAFLDPAARKEFYSYFQQFKKDRMVLIIDHHLEEVLPLVDRVFYISGEGRLQEVSKDDPRLVQAQPSQLPPFTLTTLPASELSLQKVQLSFGDKKILKNINLEAKNGEVIVIRGKNGAGKSTLFKIISGVLKPDQGTISLKKDQEKINPEKRMNSVALLFQNPETHFLFDTISEELEQCWKKSGVPDTERSFLLSSFFHALDLQKSPFLLSEGEKRRLSILMNFFSGKNIFLHDEPTFGQDRRSKFMIAGMVKSLKASGAIQIIISHDEAFINAVADRVYELVDGELR